jgi:arylsulfatase A-like enzyme
MADDGVEYEYAIAPGPRTPSSMPTIFTGHHVPPVSQEPGDFWERRRAVIRRHMRRHKSIPQRLQEHGYHTIGVTVNPWTQDTAFDRGFDEFVHINSQMLKEFGPKGFRAADLLLNDTSLGDRLYWFNKREWFIRWTDFYETIVDLVHDASEPYFLWVFLLDTHQPYVVPQADRAESSTLGMYYASFRELTGSGTIPDWVDTRLRQAYRDSIRSTDRFLSRLLESTASTDPVVAVHSDHGEAFGEHGTYGHEQQLYEENIHVPLVVHNVPDCERISEPLAVRRLPEIVDALVEPTAFDPTAFTTEYVFSAVDDGHTNAVTTRDWKLIRGQSGDELYDLRRDPEERTNVIDEDGTPRERLRSLLRYTGSHRTEQAHIAEAVGAGVGRL